MTDLQSTGVTWSAVAARLAPARNYWLATVDPGGAPHGAPVWGAVVAEVLYLYSSRGSVKARNLAADRRVVVHLESGDDVCIVHGDALDDGHPAGRPDVVAALARKYDGPGDAPYLPSSEAAFDVLYELRPRRALLWNLDDYEGSQTRWVRE